jgi:hypothetical protein
LASSSDVIVVDKKQEEQQQHKKHITITKCLSDPCPRFYTDTLCESILIECKSPKHNKDIQKVEEEEGKVTRPANSKPQPSDQVSPDTIILQQKQPQQQRELFPA